MMDSNKNRVTCPVSHWQSIVKFRYAATLTEALYTSADNEAGEARLAPGTAIRFENDEAYGIQIISWVDDQGITRGGTQSNSVLFKKLDNIKAISSALT